MTIKVSFIIPHKGREELLMQTVESIFAQDYPLTDIEIIIISQNQHLELLDNIHAQIELSVIYQPEHLTISSLRNIGAKLAQGEFLAFLDADVKLAENWLRELLNTLSTDKYRVLVSAMQINSPQAPALEQIRTVLSNAEIDCNLSFMPGRNLLLAKTNFELSGGFPEHLITCEDYHFTNKLSKIGKLYYTSASHYIHLGEDKTYIPMFKKEIWRGQSNLLSIKGRVPPMRELPSFIIPSALVLLCFIATISTIVGTFSVALICLILIFIPIILYSVRLALLSKYEISFMHILAFYLLYFPARSLGTLMGSYRWLASYWQATNV